MNHGERQRLVLLGIHDMQPLAYLLHVHDRRRVRDAEVPGGEYRALWAMRQVGEAAFLLGTRE